VENNFFGGCPCLQYFLAIGGTRCIGTHENKETFAVSDYKKKPC
jgi:hypothetical protein